MSKKEKTINQNNGYSLLGLLKPHKGSVFLLILLTAVPSGLGLWLPKLISEGIDGYASGKSVSPLAREYALITIIILVLSYFQNILQAFLSERVARDLRRELIEKISNESLIMIQKLSSSRLLTNLTSDLDSIKAFVSQAFASLVSSVFLIIGGSAFILYLDWRLGLVVLATMPFIALTFFLVFRRIHKLFLRSREVIDWLNRVIEENIIGAALIRVLNSGQVEKDKFAEANSEAKETGFGILKLFAAMIPAINFIANLAVLAIVVLGGSFVIDGTMTLGELAAFNGYLNIIIFPVIILGFVSTFIAQAQASLLRVNEVLSMPPTLDDGHKKGELTGAISVRGVSLLYGEKKVLKDISFEIKPGTHTAIIGPTAAGKTQLLYLLIGLLKPSSGEILYDGSDVASYSRDAFYRQIGIVFEDSIIFNSSLKENIAFDKEMDDEMIKIAIHTAELDSFVEGLPDGMDTLSSERGSSLSGGQKQRIMLARALAIDPKILLLDDFTARVDTATEKKILENIRTLHPGLTLVSITQKLDSVADYDNILVLMEGELVASGTHNELMKTSPEYVQIYESQKSTNAYEI